MVADQPGDKDRRLAREVGIELGTAELGYRRMQGRLGQVEVVPRHLLSEPVEHPLVVLDRLPQPRPELFVLAALLDPPGDRLADLLRDRHPSGPGDRLQLRRRAVRVGQPLAAWITVNRYEVEGVCRQLQ